MALLDLPQSIYRRTLSWFRSRIAPDSTVLHAINIERERPWLEEQLRTWAGTYYRRQSPLVANNQIGETAEMRQAYRSAVAEPAVKAALLGKIGNVLRLDLEVIPQNKDNPLEVEAAEYVHDSLLGPSGTIYEFGWPVLSGGLIDGFSVSEKLPAIVDRGKWRGKWTIQSLKAKDTQWLQLETDTFRNVTGIYATTGNMGHMYDPSDFVVYSYLPFFSNPFGMSDLRAAYRAIKMILAAVQMRMILLDKYSGPYLIGRYKDPANRARIEAAMSAARSQGWISLPEGTDVQVMNLLQSGTSEFQASIDDLRKEIAISISGAFLHMLEGSNPGVRGNSSVQKENTDTFVWLLAITLAAALNQQVVPDLVDPNYGESIARPTVSLAAVTPDDIIAQLSIDEKLKQLGLDLSKSSLYDRAKRRPPKDKADTISAQPPGGDGGMGGLGALLGGGGPPDDGGNMGGDQPNEPATFAEDRDVAATGHEGRQLESILKNSITRGTQILHNAVSEGLREGRQRRGHIFDPESKERLTDAIESVIATSDLLGRARIQERAARAEKAKGLHLFAEDKPFSSLGTVHLKPLPADDAIRYFQSLVPSLRDIDEDIYANEIRRTAFTMAAAVEETLLKRTQDYIRQQMELGLDYNPAQQIEELIDHLGVSPSNPQYSEMVWRTNAMDAYNTGARDEMTRGDMTDMFPVWEYVGVADGRQGEDHAPHFGTYWPSSVDFGTVRGPRVYNCRCSWRPVDRYEWAEKQRQGVKLGSVANNNTGLTVFSERDDRAEQIAEILYGLYGDDVLDVLEHGEDGIDHFSEDTIHMFAGDRSHLVKKLITMSNGKQAYRWVRPDSGQPKQPSGKRAVKATPEAKQAAREAIGAVIRGEASGKDMAHHLDKLTVPELRSLHKEHGKPVPGRLRAQLVEAIKAQLGEAAAQPQDAASPIGNQGEKSETPSEPKAKATKGKSKKIKEVKQSDLFESAKRLFVQLKEDAKHSGGGASWKVFATQIRQEHPGLTNAQVKNLLDSWADAGAIRILHSIHGQDSDMVQSFESLPASLKNQKIGIDVTNLKPVKISEAWTVTRNIIDNVLRKNGGDAKIVDVVDEMKKQFPGMTSDQAHGLLLKLEKADMVTLRGGIPQHEKRAKEAPQVPGRGILLFVEPTDHNSGGKLPSSLASQSIMVGPDANEPQSEPKANQTQQTDDSPKEGDRKGDLVFRDGRWHKDAEEQAGQQQAATPDRIEQITANPELASLDEYLGTQKNASKHALETARQMHLYRVNRALEQGKPVAPEAFSAYPDLAKKYPEQSKFTGTIDGAEYVNGNPKVDEEFQAQLRAEAQKAAQQQTAQPQPTEQRATTGSIPEKTAVTTKNGIMDVYNSLKDQKYFQSGLVPIWEVRKHIQEQLGDEAASREVFDKLMNQLRLSGKVLLISSTMDSSITPEQYAGGIPGNGETSFFMKQIEPYNPEKVDGKDTPKLEVKQDMGDDNSSANTATGKPKAETAKSPPKKKYTGPITPTVVRKGILDIYNDLKNETYFQSGLVPIWEIRERMKEQYGEQAASPDMFNKIANQMRLDDPNHRVLLIPSTMDSSITPEQFKGSIPGNGETLFLMKILPKD